MAVKYINGVVTKLATLLLPKYIAEEKGYLGYINRDIMVSVYENYHKSLCWKNLVIKVKERDNYICRECGADRNNKKIMVHHTSYENWGMGDRHEENDCISLCPKCHNKVHRENTVEVPFFATRSAGSEMRESVMTRILWSGPGF